MELNWQNDIDVASLSTSQQAAYNHYKAAYKTAKEAREKFEGTMQANAPAGKRIVFNYRFGKLSVALADDKPQASTNGKAKLTLAQWLDNQR